MINARHAEILKFVEDNPECSTNKVYIATSPVCKRTGRRRSQGTSGWTIPRTLTQAGLVRIKVDNSKVHSHYDRFKVRYHWKLTKLGRKALKEREAA